MKIKKTHKPISKFNLKKYHIVVGSVLFVIISFTILELANVTHIFNKPKANPTQQKNDSENNTDNKKNFIDNNTKNANTSTNQEIIQNHTTSDITLSTRRETDGSVTISTQLKNYSDGTCDVKVTNGSKIYDQSVAIIYQPSGSTCAGFNIPVDNLGFGNWQISLSITSKGQTNTIISSFEVTQ